MSLVTERAAARVELHDPSGLGEGHDLGLRSLGGEPLAQLEIAPAAAADMVAILEALKQAGAMKADLVIL